MQKLLTLALASTLTFSVLADKLSGEDKKIIGDKLSTIEKATKAGDFAAGIEVMPPVF